ncbi:capsid cement protein [Sulfurimonas sp. ST-25]|uniref:capsid cement protein n=1 Tax=Sulfurimonas sp. ST-25 TaxID=3400151 RepID=UPI003A858909
MAKEATLYQPGDRIDYTCTAAVDVGEVVPLGTSMIGIASTAGLTGEVIALEVEKVWEIPAADADAVAIGDLLYFDPTNRVLTTVSAAMVRAGRALSAKAALAAGSIYIKINAA